MIAPKTYLLSGILLLVSIFLTGTIYLFISELRLNFKGHQEFPSLYLKSSEHHLFSEVQLRVKNITFKEASLSKCSFGMEIMTQNYTLVKEVTEVEISSFPAFQKIQLVDCLESNEKVSPSDFQQNCKWKKDDPSNPMYILSFIWYTKRNQQLSLFDFVKNTSMVTVKFYIRDGTNFDAKFYLDARMLSPYVRSIYRYELSKLERIGMPRTLSIMLYGVVRGGKTSIKRLIQYGLHEDPFQFDFFREEYDNCFIASGDKNQHDTVSILPHKIDNVALFDSYGFTPLTYSTTLFQDIMTGCNRTVDLKEAIEKKWNISNMHQQTEECKKDWEETRMTSRFNHSRFVEIAGRIMHATILVFDDGQFEMRDKEFIKSLIKTRGKEFGQHDVNAPILVRCVSNCSDSTIKTLRNTYQLNFNVINHVERGSTHKCVQNQFTALAALEQSIKNSIKYLKYGIPRSEKIHIISEWLERKLPIPLNKEFLARAMYAATKVIGVLQLFGVVGK